MKADELFKSVSLDPLVKQTSFCSGQIDLADFSRLAPLLLSTDGVVDFSLQFMQDDTSRRIVKITIDCGFMLECQRCLQPMCYEVAVTTLLAIVANEEAAECLPEGYEPLVLTTNEVILGEVLEDELLLQLPLVAKHGEAEICRFTIPQALQADAPKKTSKKPFATLNTLLRSDKDGSSKE
ncbi:MAG: YceD family protein [Pseudomonadota bacterium]|nr:YceD family protein [Pseudomonadota bacterium]